MRILGIDPGTVHVGYGVIDGDLTGAAALAWGTISAEPEADLATRLLHIADSLNAVLAEHAPDCTAMETAFHGVNAQTAIRIGEARGALMVCAARAGQEVTGYPPATVKRSVCGNGRGGKRQVRIMVASLLGLNEDDLREHEADALAVAVCHGRRACLPGVSPSLVADKSKLRRERTRRRHDLLRRVREQGRT